MKLQPQLKRYSSRIENSKKEKGLKKQVTQSNKNIKSLVIFKNKKKEIFKSHSAEKRIKNSAN